MKLKRGDLVEHNDYYFSHGGMRTRPWAVGLEGVVTGVHGMIVHVKFPGHDSTYRIARVNLKKVGSATSSHAPRRARVAGRRGSSHKHGPRATRCSVCGI